MAVGSEHRGRGRLVRPEAPPAPPRRTRRHRYLALGLILTLLLGGCAYFNTFYHAKKFYGDAEKVREQEAKQAAVTAPGARSSSTTRGNDLYRKAIEKCEKLIEDYPDSKWVDDAHLLMAKSFYGKGDYISARRELERFPDRFPESNLLPDAYFWRGLTAFAQEDYVDAQHVWGELIELYPDFDDRESAEYYLAEVLQEEDRATEAIEAYGQFLESYPKGEHAVEAKLDLGTLLTEARRFEEAEAIFTEVAARSPREEDRIEARLLLGELYEDQDREQEALDIYLKVALELDSSVYEGRMSAEEREAIRQEELAAREAALEDSLLNSKFLANQPGTPGADPDAAYVDDEDLEDAERVDNLFGNPSGQDPPGTNPPGQNPGQAGLTQTSSTPGSQDPFQQTQQQQQQQQQQLRKTRDIRNPDDEVLGRVLIREGNTLARLERPWEAIMAYEQVMAEFPGTPFAAEAQYRIGYTYEVYLEDFDLAQKAYNDVGGRGRSSFTEDAARRAKSLDAVKQLLGAPSDSLDKEVVAEAEARFLKAELFLFQQEKPERALEEYQAIETDFPGTDQAAKAALAIAWVRMNALADTARGRAKYMEIMRTYPDTEYGRRAHRILKGPEREPEETDFAGPTLMELQDPENIASVTLRDSLLTAAEAPPPETIPGGAGALTDAGTEDPSAVSSRQAELLERRRTSPQEDGGPDVGVGAAAAAAGVTAAGGAAPPGELPGAGGGSAGDAAPPGGDRAPVPDPEGAGTAAVGTAAVAAGGGGEPGPGAVPPEPVDWTVPLEHDGEPVVVPETLPAPEDVNRRPLPRGPSGQILDPHAIPTPDARAAEEAAVPEATSSEAAPPDTGSPKQAEESSPEDSEPDEQLPPEVQPEDSEPDEEPPPETRPEDSEPDEETPPETQPEDSEPDEETPPEEGEPQEDGGR